MSQNYPLYSSEFMTPMSVRIILGLYLLRLRRFQLLPAHRRSGGRCPSTFLCLVGSML